MATLEGQMLGKYRVLNPLGRGGMARVYRAYHSQLDRYVAIKVMRSDLADDAEFQVRFQREARGVAALRHPNIVQVFDFDSEGDISYMVMELMEGDTLKTRLADYRVRGEQMPWGEMVRVMLDVLDGLAYAHSEGMIHRDIKPGNILLTRRGQAVIGDFGIAHIIGGTRYTAPNALMGTLQYMAPEQGLEGRSDARSDIYSLGIVLYEMLTLRCPFEADTPLAVLMKHVNDPLPLPRALNPAIPEALERVVLKALAKKPEARYQGAADMAQALRRAAADAGLDLPTRISLPLSFTTDEAPSEPVAVISGTTRNMLVEANFADDETDVTSGRKLLRAAPEDVAPSDAGSHTDPELAEAGKALLSAMGAAAQVIITRTTDALRKVTETAQHTLPKVDSGLEQAASEGGLTPAVPDVVQQPGQVGRAVLLGLSIAGGSNFLMLTFAALTGGWRLFEVGWPIELFFVSLFFCMLMYAAANIWLVIPTGIIFGTGLLLTYTSLTNLWDHWSFLWLLEIWVIAISVLTPVLLSKQKDRVRILSQQIAWLLGSAAVAMVAVTGFISLLGALAFPFVFVISVVWWVKSRQKKERISAEATAPEDT